MKKLKLTLDDLQVDTFIAEAPSTARRTVFAYWSEFSDCGVGCNGDTSACTGTGGACTETAEGDTMCDANCTNGATMCAVDTCATAGGCDPC